MLPAVANVAMGQAHNLQPRWSTRMAQCDPPATCEDWMFASFCIPCAAASAKSQADHSNICYNIMCWHPIGTYSYIRHLYGLQGSCGDDMGYGTFCMPCSVRQGVTEARLKGFVGGMAGSRTQEWHVSLFDCGCCELFEAMMCPFCVAHEVRGYLQPTAAPDCCFDILCLIPTAMYGQARHTYGIITDCDPAEDVCVPLVCFPCALVRARNECRWQIQHGTAIVNAGVQMGQAAVASILPGAQNVAAPPVAHNPPAANPAYGHPQQQQGYGQPQQQQAYGQPQQQQAYGQPQQQQQQKEKKGLKGLLPF